MNLTVNGEPHTHRGNGTIPALLEELGAQAAHTALMLNGSILPVAEWENTMLSDNDEIEMLVFVGGG